MGGQPWASDEAIARLRQPYTLTELTPLATEAGVTRSVVIQTVNDEWETRDLLALASGMDPYSGSSPSPLAGNLLAGVVGWVDVTRPDVSDAVARLRSGSGGSFLCGIRHPLLSEPNPEWLIRPDVLNGLRALGADGLSFDVVALPHQLQSTVTAAQLVPDLRFVLDHMGGPPVDTAERARDGRWAVVIRSLGALPNVTCKLSGVHGLSAHVGALRPYYDVVMESFGPDRLMFGSDWPVSSLGAGYGEVCAMYRELTADLSPHERTAVFERTARQVYRLQESLN